MTDKHWGIEMFMPWILLLKITMETEIYSYAEIYSHARCYVRTSWNCSL